MMVRFQLLLVLWLLIKALPVHAVEVVEGAAYQKPEGLVKAIALLQQTEAGREIYQRAHEAQVPIREGKISKTEITATRTLEGKNERYDFVVQVLISQDKDPVFQALDLAHELVHAVSPKKNPFDPNMNASEYVQHGIEGEGGEANAIAEECKVGRELSDNKAIKSETVQLIKARCQYVWKLENDNSKWKKSFYQLGQYYHNFIRALNATKPDYREVAEWNEKLEAKSPMFSSAAAHKPYPVALLEEYLEVTKIVCDRAMKSRIGRGIASFTAFEERCKAIRNSP
ncbi:MAG: hypothetical protein JST80_05515 [Bdellovibrionales bacterium]|nr:hypothetical protein [Bdellovibrionales bacterium]